MTPPPPPLSGKYSKERGLLKYSRQKGYDKVFIAKDLGAASRGGVDWAFPRLELYGGGVAFTVLRIASWGR